MPLRALMPSCWASWASPVRLPALIVASTSVLARVFCDFTIIGFYRQQTLPSMPRSPLLAMTVRVVLTTRAAEKLDCHSPQVAMHR
jgi:hypothetical protein